MTTPTLLPRHSQAHFDREAKLLDECRELQAKLYGKRLELAMHAGLREDAQHWLQCMETVIRERRETALGAAEKAGQCFFAAAGQYDGQQVREGAIG